MVLSLFGASFHLVCIYAYLVQVCMQVTFRPTWRKFASRLHLGLFGASMHLGANLGLFDARMHLVYIQAYFVRVYTSQLQKLCFSGTLCPGDFDGWTEVSDFLKTKFFEKNFKFFFLIFSIQTKNFVHTDGKFRPSRGKIS